MARLSTSPLVRACRKELLLRAAAAAAAAAAEVAEVVAEVVHAWHARRDLWGWEGQGSDRDGRAGCLGVN